MKILLLSLFIVFFPSSEAYIPSYTTILSHLAYSRGRGGYRIEQKIVFQQGVEPITLKEIWWIHKSGKIRVDVWSTKKELKDTYLRYIYIGNKKFFKNESNKIQKTSISYYHLERPFYLRDKNKLQKLFSLWKISPFNIPESREDPNFNSFVKLTRKGGKLQYKISQKNTDSSLFIDQDEFIIRSWQWHSQGKLTASGYKLYPGHLFFPSYRLFRDATTEIAIKVQKVQKVSLDKKMFFTSKLLKKNKIPQSISSANQGRIREFYKKFR